MKIDYTKELERVDTTDTGLKITSSTAASVPYKVTLEGYEDYICYPHEGLIYSKKTKRFIGYKDCSRMTRCGRDSTYKQVRIFGKQGSLFGTIGRLVWVFTFGEVPEGWDVHHIDGNKLDDRITNLCILTKKEHQRIHASERYGHTEYLGDDGKWHRYRTNTETAEKTGLKLRTIERGIAGYGPARGRVRRTRA